MCRRAGEQRKWGWEHHAEQQRTAWKTKKHEKSGLGRFWGGGNARESKNRQEGGEARSKEAVR